MKRESGRGQCALIARVPAIHYTMMMAAQIYDPPFRPYVYVPPVYSAYTIIDLGEAELWFIVFHDWLLKRITLLLSKTIAGAFFSPLLFFLFRSFVRSFGGRALDGG
jgi:hypothetical protein